MPEPVYRGGVEIARQQPDLEVIQHIERAFASLHRTLAALGRILLDTLQREQRVDVGRRLGREGGACLRRRGGVRQGESRRTGPPGIARWRAETCAVRSVDAHAEFSRRLCASFTSYWLTGRKRPGKICRHGQFCPSLQPRCRVTSRGLSIKISMLSPEIS